MNAIEILEKNLINLKRTRRKYEIVKDSDKLERIELLITFLSQQIINHYA